MRSTALQTDLVLLPEACFIHVIRDGGDVALSVKDLWLGANSV
jgi:hypothetical protein